jgi:hypothetical protein
MNPAFTLNYERKFLERRGKPGDHRRITVQVIPGRAVSITTLQGLAGLAFEVEAHRLRSEGLPLRSSF